MVEEAERVAVDFHDCDAGWVRFGVSCVNHSVSVHASEVFDPFPDLVAWLEAIAVGVQECAFEIDEEGSTKRFEFRRVSYDTFRFAIQQGSRDGTVLLEFRVDPRQLVGEFYGRLRSFAQSPLYRQNEWEVETLEERFAREFTGPVSHDEMVNRLLERNREELQAVFFRLAPSYLVTYPGAQSEGDGLVRFVQDACGQEESGTRDGMVEIPEEWDIPSEYDLWPDDRKAKFLAECLSEPVSSFYGTKLGEVRSTIIDAFLASEA